MADKLDGDEAICKENNRKLLGSMMTVEWAKGSVGQKPGYGRNTTRRSPPPRPPGSPPRPPAFEISRNRSHVQNRDRDRPLSPLRRRDRSPIKRDRSPIKRDRSPIRRNQSPIRRDRSPI